jgi:hypothetical protein
VAEDPHEYKNLVSARPDIAAALSAQIDAQLAVHGNAISE